MRSPFLMLFGAALALAAPARAESPADFLSAFEREARAADAAFAGFSADPAAQSDRQRAAARARHVCVAVARDAGAGTVVVVDDGPGIPAEERERMLERFHRLAAAGEGGSGLGLGLSIVQRIVELHGASLVLAGGDDGHGLRVTLRFPCGPRA